MPEKSRNAKESKRSPGLPIGQREAYPSECRGLIHQTRKRTGRMNSTPTKD
ncbi:MAG: hypothetical protein U9O91_06430 [Candidatus Caldatribacteriota bacterium]|nr:hypothetical protein [Candidatus Caldatribacteriota bacterium]